MLDDLVTDARASVDVPWDDIREARVLQRVLEAPSRPTPPQTAARRGRRPWRLAMAVAAVVAVAVSATWIGIRPGPDRAPLQARAGLQAPVAPTTPALTDDSTVVLRFADGSTAYPGHDAEIEVAVDTATSVDLRQHAGAVRYRVPARDGRRFRIAAVGIEISTEVAVFAVIVAGDAVEVVVDEGTVTIRDGARTVRLGAGERVSIRATPTPSKIVEPTPRPERVPVAIPGPDVLMRRADEARRAGKLAAAAAALQTLVEHHRSDRRVPSAWFTLGRVQLARGRARAAARAYEASWRAAKDGPLAEDALAQAAEAWISAGKHRRGTDAARRYLRAHPGGIHAARMHELVR